MRQAGFFFYQNPMFGGGPGTIFDYSFDWDNMVNVPMPFMDNSIMYPAAVGGIVAVALIGFCYICFTALNLWALGRLRNPLHRALAAIPLCYLVFLLVCAWVTWWMVDRFHITMFATTTAISLALVYHERINGSDQSIVDF
jgi:hypothetical protein